MKIQPSRSDAFVAAPDPKLRAALLYGPDAGLVRERAERLCRSVVEDLRDPFRVVELGAAELRQEPARLADEAAQLSLTGGRRVVRLREAGDAAAEPLAAFLAAPLGDALVVVEAGELTRRSKLVALFEEAENAAAIPCYLDDEEALEGLIRTTLAQAGLAIASDALDYLASHLGGDRMATRRELEKLVLYMGSGSGEVRLEDVEAAVGDSAEHSLDDAVMAAAEGETARAGRALDRALAQGETPVGALRAAQRYFQRLHLAAGQVALGLAPERAADALKPRLFWKVRPRFIAQLRLWPEGRAAEALQRLTAAEIACKSTGMPDAALAVRAFLELAGSAQRQRRGA